MSGWLLLRGLAREARHWEDFPARFAAAVREPVSCLDLSGSGEFCDGRSPAAIAGILAVLREQAHRRGLRPPLRLFGLSLGGMVALEWSLAFPAEVDRVVLLNSSLGGLSSWYRRLMPTAYRRALAIVNAGDPVERERRVLALISRHRGGDDALAQRWAEYARQRPMRAINVLRQLLAAARYRPNLAAASVPGLVLYGMRDGLVDPACSRTLAERLGWPALGAPDAGHDLPLDAPEWVIGQVRGWLTLMPPPVAAPVHAPARRRHR